MAITLPQNRLARIGIPLLVVVVITATFAFTTRDADTRPIAEEATLANIVNELKTTDQTRADLEAALAALSERNGQATVLLDSTAGKVLDDAVRVQLQNDRDNAVAVAALTVPTWQADAEKLLADIAATNAAFDASAPAVSANHEQWVVATTPPPPVPSSNGGGSKKPSTSSGGGSKNNGGGGASSGGGGGGGGQVPNGGAYCGNPNGCDSGPKSTGSQGPCPPNYMYYTDGTCHGLG